MRRLHPPFDRSSKIFGDQFDPDVAGGRRLFCAWCSGRAFAGVGDRGAANTGLTAVTTDCALITLTHFCSRCRRRLVRVDVLAFFLTDIGCVAGSCGCGHGERFTCDLVVFSRVAQFALSSTTAREQAHDRVRSLRQVGEPNPKKSVESSQHVELPAGRQKAI